MTCLVCRYDPLQDRWTGQPKLNKPRFALSAASAHGALYAVGGFNGEFYMSSVEVYDPRVGRYCHHIPLRLTPLCLTPPCLTPLCLTPLCLTPLCLTPLCLSRFWCTPPCLPPLCLTPPCLTHLSLLPISLCKSGTPSFVIAADLT